MIVTAHFRDEEFGQPGRHGQPAIDYPAEWLRDRLWVLCDALEVIREHTGPLVIVSGYRSEAYNLAVGGARQSQHIEGRAADVRPEDVTVREMTAIVDRLLAEGELPRIGGVGVYPGWVHLDVRPRVGGHVARWVGTRVES